MNGQCSLQWHLQDMKLIFTPCQQETAPSADQRNQNPSGDVRACTSVATLHLGSDVRVGPMTNSHPSLVSGTSSGRHRIDHRFCSTSKCTQVT